MDNILKYFAGEKMQCTIGVIFSVLFIAASVYFLFQDKPFFKGAAYVSLPLAFFLLIICIAVLVRTPKDIERVTTSYEQSPDKLQSEELARMEKVMYSFGIIKKVELGILILGIVLAIVFWRNPLWQGVGVGLIIQGIGLYLFDHFAELRGEEYISFLQSMG
jgi:uncharacterized membrane protein HdeD (DUF308 family)